MAARRIAGITIEIGGDTTKLEKALSGVNKTIGGTQKSLKDVNSLLKFDPKNTELLTQKQEYLKSAVDATKEKLEKEKTALAQLKANSTTDEVTEEQKALEREIVSTQTELQQLTKDYKEFGTVGGQQLQQAGKDIQNAGKKMTETGQTMTTHVTAPIVAGFTAAVKTAADFDTQMSSVQAITGATGDDMTSLRDKAREMGAKTKFSATEAGQAMEYMGMAGWKTTDIVDGLEGIMNLAAASGEDLGTTSDIVTDALTAFGLSAKDSGHFADIMAAASTNANTNVSMLGETFKYAAPVAGALGYSAEDTAIAIGLMANAGIKGSQAGTALRAGLTNLVKPSKQAADAMDKYGITVKDGNGKMYSMREMSEQLKQKLGGLDEAEQAAAAAAIFGKNAMSGWLAIINSTDEDVNKLTKAIDTCSDETDGYSGTAEKMAAVMQDNLQGQLTILMSQLQELAISFGEIAMPVVKKFVGIIQNVVDWFNKLSPATKETIAKIAAVAAAIGPVLLVGGKLVTGVGSVITVVGKLAGAIGAGGAIAGAAGGGGLIASIGGFISAAAPLLVGGAVVAGLVAGGIAIYKNWDKIKETAGKVASAVKEKWEGLKKGLSTVMTNIADGAKKGWETLKTNVVNIASSLGTSVKGKFDSMKTSLSDAVTNIGTAVKTKFETIKTGVTTIVTNLVSGAKTGFENMKTQLSTVGEGIATAVKGKFETLKTNVTTVITSLASAANEKFNALKTSLGTIVTNIGTAVKEKFTSLKTGVTTIATNLATGVKNGFTTLKDGLGTIVGGIVSTVKSKFDTLKSNVSKSSSETASAMKTNFNTANTNSATIFTKIASTLGQKLSSISTAANTMATKVSSALSTSLASPLESANTKLSTLKYNLEHFSWHFPRPSLPQFTLNTKTTTIGGKSFTYPSSVSVSWYRKAYENAMMFTSPTVLQTPNGLKGFGDGRGGEIVLSDSKLREIAGGGATYNINVYGAEGQNVNDLAYAVQRRLVALERQREAAGLA